MSLPNFPIDKSYLVAAWLAAAFWGAFTVVFIICMFTEIKRRRESRNIITLGAIISLYCLATAHVSITLARNIQAFVIHINDGPGGAILYLADIAQPLNRSKDMIYVTVIVLADFVLLWRCFMVWHKRYTVIALPAVMVLGTAASGYGSIGQYFGPNPYVDTTVKWAEAMLATSMATNIIVTSLTAGHIWFITRGLNGKGSLPASRVRYHYLILLIIESGLFMTIAKTIEFILFELAPNDGLDGLNALYIVMDCMPQIMGICPTFIILAINLGLTTSGTSGYTYGSGRGSVYAANQAGNEATLPWSVKSPTVPSQTTESAVSYQMAPDSQRAKVKPDF